MIETEGSIHNVRSVSDLRRDRMLDCFRGILLTVAMVNPRSDPSAGSGGVVADSDSEG